MAGQPGEHASSAKPAERLLVHSPLDSGQSAGQVLFAIHALHSAAVVSCYRGRQLGPFRSDFLFDYGLKLADFQSCGWRVNEQKPSLVSKSAPRVARLAFLGAIRSAALPLAAAPAALALLGGGPAVDDALVGFGSQPAV